MINWLLKLIGDPNEKKVKSIMGIVDHINALEPEFEQFTDAQLKAKTDEFREILAQRKTSDDFIKIELWKKRLWTRFFLRLLQL